MEAERAGHEGANTVKTIDSFGERTRMCRRRGVEDDAQDVQCDQQKDSK